MGFLGKWIAAALVIFNVHGFLLWTSPPEGRYLSSVILCFVSGPLALYLILMSLW